MNKAQPIPRSIVVLISGRGSNMKALVENSYTRTNFANDSSEISRQPYVIARVISDNSTATGLTWAKERGINTTILPEISSFNTKKAYFSYLLGCIKEMQPYLVCLAGFMKILPASLIKELYPKIINIHPSLLPAFPGLNTHERALAERVTHHGCTIHIVTPEIDAGPIIAQSSLEVNHLDTATSLSERVLKKEHEIYPWVVQMICQNHIILGESLLFSDHARQEATSKGFLLPSK